MADLTARPDHWTDSLPGNWQQAINTNPILNALGRALSRQSPDMTRGIEHDQYGSVSDRNWLLEQAAGGPPKLNPLAVEVLDKGSTLAMFLGPAAKTADLKALLRAQTKSQAGMPREKVWNEEGWFQGPDGKWRFEIDDRFATWKLPKPEDMAPGKSIQTNARNALGHDTLDRSYAGIGDIPTQYVHVNNPAGPLPFGSYRTGPERVAIRAAGEFADPRSTMLHEMQHAVQMRENFSRGGNSQPGTAARHQNSIVDQINRLRPEPGVVMDADTAQTVAGLRAKLNIMPMDDTEFYRRLAGEVEARAVQSRRNLTESQRRERPPWLDYNIPENRQIVLD